MSPKAASLRIIALRALSALALCALVVTPVAALAQAACRPPAMYNFLPTASLNSVTAQGGWAAPATLIFTASADDSDGTIARVDFFDSFQGNNTLIGSTATGPYSFTWANVPSGAHTLTAKATDNRGGQTTSTPMSVYVTARVTYLHTDHLNTPRVATDANNKVIWRWAPTSEPFGNSAPEEDPDVDRQNFTLNLRMPGQYYDRETNLSYNYYRDYDPSTGRYVQADPIGLAGGRMSLYTYADNAPMMKIDPLGLSSDDPLRGGSASPPINPSAQAQQQLARRLTQMLKQLAQKICPDDQPCDPPEGTQCYEGPDYGKSHAGMSPHYHIYQMQKKRSDGTCF